MQDVRRHLFSQFKELSVTEKLDDLEHMYVDILSDRLSLLLSATLGSFTLDAAAKGRTVYESEWRHDWDEVLYRFCVTSGEGISSRLL